MTGSQAAADPYVHEFEADVERIVDGGLVLSGTYFYPEGGGQPADRGLIAGIEVVDVQTNADGDVVHYLADDAVGDDITPGDEVGCVVDPDFRRYCMRAHTASHALYGAGRRVLDDLGYGGFDIRAAPTGQQTNGASAGHQDRVRVDFETSTSIDDDVLVDLERLTNRAVWESRAVSWEELPTEEAHERDDVAFNTKTEEGVMADADTVRIVTIDGWDVAACGGTHVANTVEIGPVTVLDRSNPGEGLTRVEFTVGPSAIDRRAETALAARTAAAAAGVPVTDLPAAIERYRGDIAELEGDLDDLQAEVLDARLADLDELDRDGVTWRVGVVEGFEANAVGDRAKALVAGGDAAGAGAPDVIAATGGDGSPFLVVASEGTVDAGDVVAEVTTAFGGGGGGGPTFAQGGGLDATPADVVAHLRD
jgi:alanyl-tRNA synthetase